jgi:hypothetical protein
MLDRAVFACRRHWYMIPVRLRRNVSLAYGAWSTDPLDPILIAELEDAQHEALAAVSAP